MSSDSILDTRSRIARPQQKETTSKSNDSRSPAVEIQGLRKVYQQIIAVDEISLVTYRGEAFGLLSPKEAGKRIGVKNFTGLGAPSKAKASHTIETTLVSSRDRTSISLNISQPCI